mgnify:CR=1 FL=1
MTEQTLTCSAAGRRKRGIKERPSAKKRQQSQANIAKARNTLVQRAHGLRALKRMSQSGDEFAIRVLAEIQRLGSI